jgi:hypothetical protein
MDALTRQDIQALLLHEPGRCVSLLLPTHRGGAEEDRIGWKNLLQEAEGALLAHGTRAPEARDFLWPAAQLLDDRTFWKSAGAGLAFFLAPGFARAWRLPLRLGPRAVAGRRFHVKPLLPSLQGDGRFYVLALSQNRVRLLEGGRDWAREVGLEGVPRNLAEALRFHDKDEPLVFHTHPALGLGRAGAIFHGHGVGIDDAKDDLLNYFRQIDRGLHDLLRGEHAPLVLAGVEYLWPLYRQANTYPHLLGGGVRGNPDHLSPQELHGRAWALVGPRFSAAQQHAADLYARLAGTGRTFSDPSEAAAAAYRGGVQVLLVAGAAECPGAFDPQTGSAAPHEAPRPGDEDLLNVAAVYTLRHGGAVHVVPPQAVPSGGPVAGVYWLPGARREAG